MRAVDAMRLIGEELVLDGIPMRNLATFVTTWMEPEAQRVIAENLHRNFIDHAEYPQTAEIEQRCIRMLADLFHAPGETTGARTQGSSEAIMLGALSLKWKWRERREQAGKDTDRPNLVFGGDVHVVWEKFCRYFDVEPRIIPLQPDKYTIGPEDVEPHVDENTIGVAAVLGTTFTGHADDIVGINDLLVGLKDERGSTCRCTSTRPAAASCGRSSTPTPHGTSGSSRSARSTSRGTSSGSSTPGIGWLVFRETERPPEDLVFYENYLGKTDATFTLNFSTGSAMVLAQYYNFVRFGHDGYRYIMETMQQNAALLAERIAAIGEFHLIGGEDEEQLPLVAFQLAGERNYDEFDVAVAARCGARLDGARLHAAAERGARHDHARARQADARPLAGQHARRRHRRGLRDAQGEGRPARAGPQAREDRLRRTEDGPRAKLTAALAEPSQRRSRRCLHGTLPNRGSSVGPRGPDCSFCLTAAVRDDGPIEAAPPRTRIRQERAQVAGISPSWPSRSV